MGWRSVSFLQVYFRQNGNSNKAEEKKKKTSDWSVRLLRHSDGQPRPRHVIARCAKPAGPPPALTPGRLASRPGRPPASTPVRSDPTGWALFEHPEARRLPPASVPARSASAEPCRLSSATFASPTRKSM